MHARLHDLRLLYLAARVEEAFEGLEKALARHLDDPRLADDLRVLFEGGAAHHRLEAELARVSHEVEADTQRPSAWDLLQALLDCERTAQRFYLEHMDDLSDPHLVELFRDLADEEGSHALAVQRAQAKLSGRGPPEERLRPAK